MPPLTNSQSPSAASDPGTATLPSRPKSEILAQDIELPPSPQDEVHSLPSSPLVPTPSPSSSYFARSPRLLSAPGFSTPSRPRASSPNLSSRPLSAGGMAAIAPPMQRAHSSPGVDSSGRFIIPYSTPRRPSSPLNAGRRRSPLRLTVEEPYAGVPSWSGLSIEPNIPENEELDFTSDISLSHNSPISSFSNNTFPRSRRRPTSPLHQSASAPTLQTRAVSPGLRGRTSTSPLLPAQKFTYDTYPMYSYSSASSMPSTPTSLRSRSPSISSLETIEDIPDAEEAAMLEEDDAAPRSEDGEAGDPRRRSSLEARGSNLRSNKERKRWSVSGAERRADFSLEPIEE